MRDKNNCDSDCDWIEENNCDPCDDLQQEINILKNRIRVLTNIINELKIEIANLKLKSSARFEILAPPRVAGVRDFKILPAIPPVPDPTNNIRLFETTNEIFIRDSGRYILSYSINLNSATGIEDLYVVRVLINDVSIPALEGNGRLAHTNLVTTGKAQLIEINGASLIKLQLGSDPIDIEVRPPAASAITIFKL